MLNIFFLSLGHDLKMCNIKVVKILDLIGTIKVANFVFSVHNFSLLRDNLESQPLPV